MAGYAPSGSCATRHPCEARNRPYHLTSGLLSARSLPTRSGLPLPQGSLETRSRPDRDGIATRDRIAPPQQFMVELSMALHAVVFAPNDVAPRGYLYIIQRGVGAEMGGRHPSCVPRMARVAPATPHPPSICRDLQCLCRDVDFSPRRVGGLVPRQGADKGHGESCPRPHGACCALARTGHAVPSPALGMLCPRPHGACWQPSPHLVVALACGSLLARAHHCSWPGRAACPHRCGAKT